MNSHLALRNRQRTCPVDLRRLRQLIKILLVEDVADGQSYELGVHLVADPEMTRLNEQYLRHAGATDVITFDYREETEPASNVVLFGDIFVCLDEAVRQARRFRTSWPKELARYVIHGLLHLRGFDDHHPDDRRHMKREENRRLRKVSQCFPLSTLQSTATVRQ